MNSMTREKAVSDAIAGVTVGLTVIPQVLAFGKIRGSNLSNYYSNISYSLL